MTDAQNKAVIKRWTAKLVVRRGLEKAARQRYIWKATKANKSTLNLRRKQVSEAETVLARHRKDLSKPPLRVRALEAAKKDLDVRETAGNNWGGTVTKIIRANGGTGPEAWCGDAVAYWYRAAGSKLVQRAWASTIWLASHLTPVKNPLPGHIVVYDFGSGSAQHTGLFERWANKGSSFYAIEGNTGVVNGSDGGGGEGVERKLRYVSSVLAFRRIAT